jgi:PPM family protein phosphatase
MQTSSEAVTPRPTGETAPQGTLRVLSAGATDRGQLRSKNEDQFAITEVRGVLRVRQSSVSQPEVQVGDQLGHLLIVADGMGGHQAGEVASAMAVTGIENLVLNTIGWLCRLRGEGVLNELREALRTTDRWLEEAAGRQPELQGMGTTLTMGYVTGRTLYLAHAGDSRCYRWRAGKLEQLTQDHTVVARLLSDGAITAEEAAHHSLRNVVMNAVGGGTKGVEPEVHKHVVAAGDRLLLCTDGLTKMLPDTDIAAIVGGPGSPAGRSQLLVDEANRRGGEDNITVVVVDFEESPANSPT